MLPLNAIGIYTQVVPNDWSVLKKTKYAQEEKDSAFFKKNQLENIDNYVFHDESKDYLTLEDGFVRERIFIKEPLKEYNYLFKSNYAKALFAISSKSELSEKELGFLYKNIEYIFLKPESTKETLDKMIANPYGFNGREIFKGSDAVIDKIREDLKFILVKMRENIDLVLERGEKLEELEKKAIHLKESAIKFDDKAKELNSCCWYW